MSRMISADKLVHALSSEHMIGKKTLLQVIEIVEGGGVDGQG